LKTDTGDSWQISWLFLKANKDLGLSQRFITSWYSDRKKQDRIQPPLPLNLDAAGTHSGGTSGPILQIPAQLFNDPVYKFRSTNSKTQAFEVIGISTGNSCIYFFAETFSGAQCIKPNPISVDHPFHLLHSVGNGGFGTASDEDLPRRRHSISTAKIIQESSSPKRASLMDYVSPRRQPKSQTHQAKQQYMMDLDQLDMAGGPTDMLEPIENIRDEYLEEILKDPTICLEILRLAKSGFSLNLTETSNDDHSLSFQQPLSLSQQQKQNGLMEATHGTLLQHQFEVQQPQYPYTQQQFSASTEDVENLVFFLGSLNE
jgi:hypothetical protein